MVLENVPGAGHVYVFKAPSQFAEKGVPPFVKIGIGGSM